jgi:outer membrane protein assembly factor BamC
MVRLGADDAGAKTASMGAGTSGAPTLQDRPAPDRARIAADKKSLTVDEAYDTAWRRLGLALDRSGFTIDDRNYSAGEYYIRYARAGNEKSGFFEKMFSDDKKTGAQKLKIILQKNTAQASSTATSTVLIQTEQGGVADADIVQNLLTVLRDELK